MSQGINLLAAVIAARSNSAVRMLDEALFTDEERPALNYLLAHYRQYGVLPSIEVMREQGFAMRPATQPVDYYLSRVRRRAIGNQWQDLHPQFATALGQADTEAGLQTLEQMVRAARRFGTTATAVSLADAAEMVRQDYLSAAASSDAIRGITFGWPYLDSLTSGAQDGDVFAFVARPKVGKSWTVLYNALAAWRQGRSVLFVSMEMAVLQAARRYLAMYAGLPPTLIRTGQLSMHARDAFFSSLDSVEHGSPFRIVAGDLKKSVDDVNDLCLEFTPDVVYVDAAYLLDPSNVGGKYARYAKHEALQEVLRGLKSIALLRNIPIIITVQFNREGAKKGGGELEHVGGSDWIGQIASGVVSIAPGSDPYSKTRRRYKVIAGRDMEMGGEFETNFLFQPFDMDFVSEVISGQSEASNHQHVAQMQQDMI